MDCGPRCYCPKFPRQSGSALRLIFNINSFVCNSAIITSAQPHYRLNTNTLSLISNTKHLLSLLYELPWIQSALSTNKEASKIFQVQCESQKMQDIATRMLSIVWVLSRVKMSRYRHLDRTLWSYSRHWGNSDMCRPLKNTFQASGRHLNCK